MGIGGISIWQLLIVLVIVLLLFGTKKLRNLGGDLGSSIKSFKKAVKEGNESKTTEEEEETPATEEEAIEEAEQPAKEKEEKD